MPSNPSNELVKLKNIGVVLAEWLNEIDIHTRADIEQLGAAEVFIRLKHRFPNDITLHALYALEGALTNTRWLNLPDDVKANLRKQVGLTS